MRVGAAVLTTPGTPQIGIGAPALAPGVLLHRLSGPLNALLACGFARLSSGGVIELFLNASEATDGGMIAIAMSVVVHCPQCAGYADSAAKCSRCGGRRTVHELFSAWLAIPPGIADGSVLYPSAVLPGMVQPVSFRVRR
jgi:hypothetical protein